MAFPRSLRQPLILLSSYPLILWSLISFPAFSLLSAAVPLIHPLLLLLLGNSKPATENRPAPLLRLLRLLSKWWWHSFARSLSLNAIRRRRRKIGEGIKTNGGKNTQKTPPLSLFNNSFSDFLNAIRAGRKRLALIWAIWTSPGAVNILAERNERENGQIFEFNKYKWLMRTYFRFQI